jgi:pimeloyl-ACP methyl ester carboxylesterase
VRLGALALVCVLATAGMGRAAEQEIKRPARPAPLSGTLTLPPGDGRVPGALIIGDAGPTDRNGNQPGLMNDSYRRLADGLSACGVATLRTDKRGVALSAAAEPDESNLTVETYVQDSADWLDWLRARPRVSGVALLGHGEGTLIASLVAQRAAVARIILVEGLGRRPADALRAQLRAIDMAPVLRRRADQMIRLLERGKTDDEPPAGLTTLFRPSIQPFLISLFRLDPVAEFSKLSVPALIVQGTADLQVGVPDARALAAARPGARLEILSGVNHVLRAVPEDESANLATYTDTSRPLAPALLPALCAFLRP